MSPSNTKTFQPTTTPSARQSGQKGRPNGQAAGFSWGSATGRNEYGSRHGYRPCSIWCPGSQRR